MDEVSAAIKAGSLPAYFEDIAESVDSNGDGKIDITEFMTAAQDIGTAFTTQNIKKVFSIFDKDGDGSISKAELNSVF